MRPGMGPPTRSFGDLRNRSYPRSAGLALFLCLLGLVPGGCATDEVGPGKGSGYVIWIAQEVNGHVQQEVTGTPVVGATVTLYAGFALNALIPIASGTTRVDGSYDILRSQTTGVPGDYWWFTADNAVPVTLIVQAQIQHRDYLTVYPRVTVQRTPNREPPSTNYGAYALTLSAIMTRVSAP